MEDDSFVHERYFQTVSNLGDNGVFRKESEKSPANLEGKRRDKYAERHHLRRKEHEGERVAAWRVNSNGVLRGQRRTR